MNTRAPHVRTVFPNSAPDFTPGDAPWMGDCHEDPQLFDDSHDESDETPKERVRRHQIAVSICLSCPLLGPYERALAAQTGMVSGVWAGRVMNVSARERRAVPSVVRDVRRTTPPLPPVEVAQEAVCAAGDCHNLLPPRWLHRSGPARVWCEPGCRKRSWRARGEAA